MVISSEMLYSSVRSRLMYVRNLLSVAGPTAACSALRCSSRLGGVSEGSKRTWQSDCRETDR